MKKILATSVLTLFTIIAFSQEYGTIKYMGHKVSITSEFFQSLNRKYNDVMYTDSKTQKIYYSLVDFLKKSNALLEVDEAKRISWHATSTTDFPYGDYAKVSKRDSKIASIILYDVLLPVIETYARN